ncbi:MAG: hypothetical protein WBG37_14610, partial [Desulfobacterales bacterium]
HSLTLKLRRADSPKNGVSFNHPIFGAVDRAEKAFGESNTCKRRMGWALQVCKPLHNVKSIT